MRATLAVLAVVVGCAVSPAADDKYESKDGKFKVAFPKGAKVTTKQQDGGKGTPMHLFTVEQAGRAFVVMYMVLPENVVAELSAKTILDGGMTVSGKNGEKLVASKDVAFGPDKLPGRDYTLEKPGAKARTWMVLAGRRVYVVTAAGKGDFATGKDAAAFLESFEIVK